MLVAYEGKRKTKRYLRQLHLHVGKHMKETNYSIPQPAVCQTLLIPSTWPLLFGKKTKHGENQKNHNNNNKKNKTKVCKKFNKNREKIHISAYFGVVL